MPTNANAERPEWNYCHSRRSVHNVLEASGQRGEGKKKCSWGFVASVFAYAKAHGLVGVTTPSHKAGWAYGLHFTDINIYIS